jgi:hypothetical protein
MMTVRNSLFATGFACAAFCTTAANAQLGKPLDGRPVTANDLAGKKLCWDTGYWDIFAANGDYSNIRSPTPRLKWSIPEPGVIHTGSTYWQTEILPDGQFYLHRVPFEHWAKVCN